MITKKNEVQSLIEQMVKKEVRKQLFEEDKNKTISKIKKIINKDIIETIIEDKNMVEICLLDKEFLLSYKEILQLSNASELLFY